MLSLEIARKLKEAGLQWEPQMGDFFYNNGIIDCLDFSDMDFAAGYEDLTHQGDVGFIPRLDQMLAEIEKREYAWEMMRGVIEVWHRYLPTGCKKFVTETTDEAAAQALIWILGQEEKA